MLHKNGTKAIVVVLLSTFFLTFATIAGAKKIQIKYADSDPLGGMRPSFIKNTLFPEIIAQTNKDVKIQQFWGGALLSGKEMLKGIGDNSTNMGFVYPGWFPGQLPAYTVFKLFPKGPTKFKNIVWFYRKAVDELPEFSEQLANLNQKTLVYTSGLPGSFCSTKALTKLEDIKGQRWRAGDKWALRYLENVGAVPVSVPWGDTFMALQTGTLDGCFTNYDAIRLMKFDEVASNLLVTKELWFATPLLHNINLDFWNKLPTDVQQGILKACEIAEEKFCERFDTMFEKVMAEQKADGYKVTIMTAEDAKLWANQEKLYQMQQQWVEEATKAGMKNAQQFMDNMRALYKEAMAREK